jgi:PAS domain S-box-containing protein
MVKTRASANKKNSSQVKVKQPSKKTKNIAALSVVEFQHVTLEEMLVSTPNIVLLVDSKGEIEFLNRAAQKLIADETSTLKKISHYLPEVRIASLRECVKSGVNFDFFIAREKISYHFFVRNLKKSKLAAFYGIEITDLIRIEADLVSSQNILRKVLDTDPNLIFVKDIAGRFVLANQAVADAYGTSVDNLIGKTDADFNPNLEEIQKYLEDDREVILGNSEKKIEEESVTDSGGNTRFFSTVKKPLQLGTSSEVCVLGVSTDVSSLRLLKDSLHQSSKMEALGQLAGGVAHDFNNLLTAILGHAEIIRSIHHKDESVRKSVTMIEVAADRARMLTDQLLGFARKGKRQDCYIDIHVLIADTLALLRRTIDPKIVLQTQLLAEKCVIKGDPSQIQQVILNLSINARDALMELKRKTNLCLEVITRDIVGDNSSPAIEIIVADNGCGMNDSVKQRAFEPFFTTKEIGKGTGLGLSTVYGVVSNHGGEVKLESKSNSGTKFSLIFPSFNRREAGKIKAHTNGPSLKPGDRVLLVDDHEAVLEAISKMLQSLRLKVSACRSGLEAIEKLAASPDSYELAIVDMVMPEIGGSETIRELRKIRPHLPILFVSGFSNDKASQRLISQGIPFLRKPFSLDELKSSVSLALATSLYLKPPQKVA